MADTTETAATAEKPEVQVAKKNENGEGEKNGEQGIRRVYRLIKDYFK